MTTFLAYTIVGIATGCIYALTASGLVVTYTTSGIFNFAHGAIGMLCAFGFWELTAQDGWPQWLALLLILGIAMRAVVDEPELAALTGADPDRVRAVSWALGASLAGLAGILLAPLISLDIILLTLLVINGYAAAMVGRLRSLPLTFVGGLML